jgi:hypothetical protein
VYFRAQHQQPLPSQSLPWSYWHLLESTSLLSPLGCPLLINYMDFSSYLYASRSNGLRLLGSKLNWKLTQEVKKDNNTRDVICNSVIGSCLCITVKIK